MISYRGKPDWVVYRSAGDHCNIDDSEARIRRCTFYVDLIVWEFLLSLYSRNAKSILLDIGDLGVKIEF